MEGFRNHNETVFEEMQSGDFLEFDLGLYNNWSFVAGIHYDGILYFIKYPVSHDE